MPGTTKAEPWEAVSARFRERGMRWTPQRRLVVETLARTEGHVTGAELVERCRAVDADTTPSTVYRTLDVLEELGLVRHAHGANGHEEYHVSGEPQHGHLYCERCGRHWEVTAAEARTISAALRAAKGFEADLTHMTIVGVCADCAAGG
jgi:Fur family transcriptional regulator, ferric uptake regulator